MAFKVLISFVFCEYFSSEILLVSKWYLNPGGHRDMFYVLADHWPIVPSYKSSNAGGWASCGVSANEYVQLCTMNPNTNSMFNLFLNHTWNPKNLVWPCEFRQDGGRHVNTTSHKISLLRQFTICCACAAGQPWDGAEAAGSPPGGEVCERTHQQPARRQGFSSATLYSMDWISIKTPNPRCRLFLKLTSKGNWRQVRRCCQLAEILAAEL